MRRTNRAKVRIRAAGLPIARFVVGSSKFPVKRVHHKSTEFGVVSNQKLFAWRPSRLRGDSHGSLKNLVVLVEMRKLPIAILIWIICLPSQGFSQARVGANFETFYAEFKAAVTRNDAKAIAELTQLPFLFDSKPRNQNEFQRIYPELFDANIRACFASAKASWEDNAWVINCGRYIFYFRVVNRQFRFVEFAADPEAAP